MKTSPAGIALIASFEGFKDVAYQDGAGIWTIGYGHTLGVAVGLTCIAAQGDAWLTDDLAWSEAAIDRLITVPLNQNQFDALVSFTFNVGQGALAGSTLRKLLNAGNYDGAADQFGAWIHDAAGVVEPGLVTRRQKERALFLGASA